MISKTFLKGVFCLQSIHLYDEPLTPEKCVTFWVPSLPSKMDPNCFLALSIMALTTTPTTSAIRMLRKNGGKPDSKAATLTQPPTSISSSLSILSFRIRHPPSSFTSWIICISKIRNEGTHHQAVCHRLCMPNP